MAAGTTPTINPLGALTFTHTPYAGNFAGGMTDLRLGQDLRPVLRRLHFTVPSTWYVALSTAAVSKTTTSLTEPMGGSYARKAIANSPTNWLVADSNDFYGQTGDTRNAATIAFPAPTAAWGSVVATALADSATGGNVWFVGSLTAPVAPATGAPAPTFAAGSLHAGDRLEAQATCRVPFLANPPADAEAGATSATIVADLAPGLLSFPVVVPLVLLTADRGALRRSPWHCASASWGRRVPPSAISIERLSDGSLYDFSNSQFTSATPTTPLGSLPENTPSFPGQFKTTLSTTPVSQFTNGDYVITVVDRVANLCVGIHGAVMSGGDDATVIAGGPVASVVAPVTVGVNNDKAGYSLGQAFPSNFSSLSITSGAP